MYRNAYRNLCTSAFIVQYEKAMLDSIMLSHRLSPSATHKIMLVHKLLCAIMSQVKQANFKPGLLKTVTEGRSTAVHRGGYQRTK